MKILKWIIGTFVAVALLLIIVAAYFLFAIDPNSYKPQLAELAKGQNILLEIEGDLSWHLLPNLALSIGATKITSPRTDIPEISFKQADLNLAWLPLLNKQLSIKAISLDGADIRLNTAEQSANTAAAPLAAAKTNNTGETSDAPAFKLAIESLTMTDSRLQLPSSQPADRTSAQQLSAMNLQIDGLNLDGDIFKISARFNYNDPVLPEPVAITLNTEARVKQGAQSISFNQATLKLSSGGKPDITLNIPTLTAEQNGRLEIPHLVLNSAGATLQSSLLVQNRDDSIAFESKLNVPPMALQEILQRWDIELPDLPDQQALQQASLKLTIKGTNNGLAISGLNLTLDDINLDGNMELAFKPTRTVTLQLKSSAVDLNRYISNAASTDSVTKEPVSNVETDIVIAPTLLFAPLVAPLAWVENGNATINIQLDALSIDNINAQKLHIILKATNNVVHIQKLSVHVFDGDINATANINLQHQLPSVNFTGSISELSVGKAAIAFNEEASLQGKLNATFEGSSRGNEPDQLHRHINGNAIINLTKPKIATFNIEKTYCDTAAIIEKIPSKTDWPQSSSLQDLQATIRLKGKQIFIDNYTTGLGNISLRGQGVVYLGEERFDLLAISRLNGERTSEQGCLVKSRRVRDKDIPIRCKDSFAKASGSSCKPDGDFVRQVVQDKILEKIQKESGLNKESEEALKDLLKGIFGR